MKRAPLFGLHGIGSDGRTFAALATTLERDDFTALDLPGYAAEPGLPESFAALKDWLHNRLQASDRAVLVGHSIGGMLALDYALDHPDRVAGLVLVGTTPAFGGPDPSFKEAFLKARLSGLDAGKTMAEAAEGMAAGYLGRRADKATKSRGTEPLLKRQALTSAIQMLRRTPPPKIRNRGAPKRCT